MKSSKIKTNTISRLSNETSGFRENSRIFSIRTKLIAAFLFTVVPIVLLGFFSYNSAFTSISRSSAKTSLETIRQAGRYLGLSLENIEKISSQISVDSNFQNYAYSAGDALGTVTYKRNLTSLIKNFATENEMIGNIIILLGNDRSISSSDSVISENGYEKIKEGQFLATLPVWSQSKITRPRRAE